MGRIIRQIILTSDGQRKRKAEPERAESYRANVTGGGDGDRTR